LPERTLLPTVGAMTYRVGSLLVAAVAVALCACGSSLGSAGTVTAAGSGSAARAAACHPSGSRTLAVERRGQKLLDAGAHIDPTSLRLRGSVLSWRDGGRTRHAGLV
jgi:hypothetical protein